MDNKGFIKLINEFYKEQTMQVIPAFSYTVAPDYPFGTYQTRNSDTIDILIDGRVEREGKLVEKCNVYTKEELLFKVYNSTDKLAYESCIDLMNTVRFKISDLARWQNYGIIDIEEMRSYHEKADNGYIYCYGFTFTIDYNHEVERIIDILETIELTGDINKIIKVKEV